MMHESLRALSALFGEQQVQSKLSRIIEIHDYTEAKWREYAKSLQGKPVKYLLIAEAPPWSPDGTPQYFLDPSSRSRSLMRAICKVFVGAENASGPGRIEVFASRGFLLLDSIPFAMDYSAKRSSKKYDSLVRSTMTSYLQPKLDSPILSWSSELRIAFAVSRNAQAILKAAHSLTIGRRLISLSADMIAVNGAGYPDAGRLRSIFNLD